MYAQTRWLRIFGYMVIMLGLALVPIGLVLRSLYASTIDLRAVLLPFAFPAAAMIHLGRRLLAKSSSAAFTQDARPPILYLRPFATDESIVGKLGFLFLNFGIYETNEQALARLLRQLGPFVAIGRPDETLPPLGAARSYVHDSEWKEKVTGLINRASLIVVRIGDSPSFWWEVDALVQSVDARKVVFYHPVDAWPSTKKRAWMEAYSRFKQKADQLLPHPLPSTLDDWQLLTFDLDWKATPQEATARSFWGFVRGWTRGSQLPHLREGLRPTFEKLRIPVPPIPWSPIEYLTVPLFVMVGIGFPLMILILLVRAVLIAIT